MGLASPRDPDAGSVTESGIRPRENNYHAWTSVLHSYEMRNRLELQFKQRLAAVGVKDASVYRSANSAAERVGGTLIGKSRNGFLAVAGIYTLLEAEVEDGTHLALHVTFRLYSCLDDRTHDGQEQVAGINYNGRSRVLFHLIQRVNLFKTGNALAERLFVEWS